MTERSVLDRRQPVDVFCVYGPSYVKSVQEYLIPALESQIDVDPTLHLINYLAPEELLKHTVTELKVRDWSSEARSCRMGFGEAINHLFECVKPRSTFVVANPDTVPTPLAVRMLVQTLSTRCAGLVEARQWPFEHPKEYEEETLQTPWATGAFFAASPSAFEAVNGFDELLFMYNEDVDLSWRMRLSGWDILYQPKALVHHYTGLGKYQENVFYLEHFYSSRNSIVLGHKFWGEAGERVTINQLRESGLPAGFINLVLSDYLRIKPKIRRVPSPPPDKWIKILGFNRYHSLRPI